MKFSVQFTNETSTTIGIVTSCLPYPAGHHTGLLSCSSESSLHTLHKKKEAEGGGAATQSTPDLGSLARKNGSAVGKPPLQPKKVQPVSSGSPKAFSKSTPIDANQVSEVWPN